MRRFFRGILKTNAGSKPPWRTPDHPPYSEMVEVALRALSEEGGSTESSISAYIESTFTDLPWGHDRLLPYYLGKLVVSGEISSPSHDHYLLSLHHHHLLSSAHSLVGRRGRPPIYRPNPRSYPSFKSRSSASPGRQGRSLVPRFRGRRPEIFAECTPKLHLEQGSAPLRPRRGRPPLQRGGAIGGAIRRSVPRTRRPRGSRIRQDGVRGRRLSNNGDCHCFEIIRAQSSPGKLQSLLPPGLNFSSPHLPDQGEGGQFSNAGAWHCSSEISAFGNGKKDACSETCALQPMQDERGGHMLVASPQPEHGEGQLFAISLLSEQGGGNISAVREVPLLILEPAKVSHCPSLEHSEHGEGKSSQREVRPSTVIEQTEPDEEQTVIGERPTILSLEKPENDDRCPEILENDNHGLEMLENDDHGPEKPENDGHGPEKPENDGHGSEKPENDGHVPEKPGNYDHSLEKPENDDNGLEKPENDGHGYEKAENDGHGPEKPENYVHGLEKSENYVHGSEKPENDDRGPEKPENDDRGPEKPENDGRGPEKPENDDRSPEKPENDDNGPAEKLENDGHGPEKLENDVHGLEKLENDVHGPEKLENDVHGPEKLENDVLGPEKLENDVHGLEKLENDVHGPAMPENDDHGLEKPEEDHDKCSPGKRTALVALDQEVLVPLLLPDPDEVGSSGASNKKKRSHGKRRRLKLWFEG